ncbi:MAG: VWA domain-containing protein [Verrucomicrobiae bacterium]|nr:VWA domain-containing protein [Verrucomicrobiae bacterium]NNJ85898.1 VWA domain-containing protein [Akkermansiaceae bacterium]
MKNEDKMIDALLQEHARKGDKDDAEFLTSLEQRLDEEDQGGVTSIKHPSSQSGNRAGIGLGIAAAVTVAAIGFYGWHQKRQNDLATNMTYDAEIPGELASPSQPGTSTPPTVAGNVDKLNGSAVQHATEENARRGTDDVVEHDSLPPQPEAPSVKVVGKGQVSAPKEREGTISPRPLVRSKAPKPASHAESKVADSETLSITPKRGATYEQRDLNRLVPGRCIPADQEYQRPVRSGNRYGELTDNTFKSPWKQPLSTFSIDVDTASYTNVRRMIQGGQAIPKDAVRIEEMINYFNYSYPEPRGKHPFSVHVETASCPWNPEHRLVKVGLQGKHVAKEERPAANLVFLLDVSGSMNSQDKLPLLVDSMKILLKELNADDSVSIVVYAGAQGLALPPTYVDEQGRKTILAKLNNFRSGGSTNGGAGITLAYKMARKHFVKGGVNRVILGTDGDFNVGLTGTDELVSMVERQAKSGVFLSVLGFGQGNLNDAMLEKITNKGNGNYYYIDNLREGRKVFLDDMMGTMVAIAKDVKIQVEFNPAKVKSYRLIGYANRMLKAEDFKNKRIDAGEIGAGHTVTALYEIVPGHAGEASADIDDLEFQKKKPEPKPQGREIIESPDSLIVKLAYKQPDATKETESTYFKKRVADRGEAWQQASDDFKFASAVSLFGMLQRDSEYAGQGTYQLVRKLAEQGRGEDPKGHRTEFSDLVRKVAK